MLGEKACVLIKDSDMSKDNLQPYNSDLVNEVVNEIKALIDQNKEDARLSKENRTTERIPSMRIRHAAVHRNVRCLLAYHYHRLQSIKTMRWEFGSILPPDIKANLNPTELTWFSKYSSNLAQYMRSVGEEGVNLCANFNPPKVLYIEVRCLVDYGRFELNDGSVVVLKRNSRHNLPRFECEELIRKGILQHVVL